AVDEQIPAHLRLTGYDQTTLTNGPQGSIAIAQQQFCPTGLAKLILVWVLGVWTLGIETVTHQDRIDNLNHSPRRGIACNVSMRGVSCGLKSFILELCQNHLMRSPTLMVIKDFNLS
ncbi:MAG: hypothetical protein F6K19_48135, partial [Cyanothece sp. SIO1E1]|nr:hypothetical protein [Cyanothece sp. SIO1E1]